MIANLYLSPKLGEVDLDRALFLLLKIAKFSPSAHTAVIDILIQKKAYPEALELLRPLERGDDTYQIGFASERLSRCYEFGLGVKANAAKAKKYF